MVLLVNQGANRSNQQFKGDVQFIVFMNTDAQQPQIDAVHQSLETNPNVQTVTYLDHDAAFTEFKTIFKDQPEYYNNLTAADIPPNFKVKLKQTSGTSETVLSMAADFRTHAGVKAVTAAPEKIARQEKGFNTL